MASTYFTDRVVQHPGRVTLTQVSGTTYDITRNEGTVTQAGTVLNASNLNGAMDECKTYADALAAKVYESKETSQASLAAGSYIDKTVSLGTKGTKTPVVVGYNLHGTNSSYIAVSGVYITGNTTDGFTAHTKCRNIGTSAASNLSSEVLVLWIEL